MNKTAPKKIEAHEIHLGGVITFCGPNRPLVKLAKGFAALFVAKPAWVAGVPLKAPKPLLVPDP